MLVIIACSLESWNLVLPAHFTDEESEAQTGSLPASGHLPGLRTRAWLQQYWTPKPGLLPHSQGPGLASVSQSVTKYVNNRFLGPNLDP